MVYWSDVNERTIHRAHLNGSNHQIFMNYNHSLGIVDGKDFLYKATFDYKSERVSLENEWIVPTHWP